MGPKLERLRDPDASAPEDREQCAIPVSGHAAGRARPNERPNLVLGEHLGRQQFSASRVWRWFLKGRRYRGSCFTAVLKVDLGRARRRLRKRRPRCALGPRHIEDALAASSQEIAWVDEGGVFIGQATRVDRTRSDRRWYVLPAEPYVALVPDGLQEAFVGKGSDAAKAFEKEVQALRKRRTKTLFRFEARDLDRVLPRKPDARVPRNLEVRLDDKKTDEFHAALVFKDAAEAMSFEDLWTTTVKDALDSNVTMKLMIGALYDAALIKRKKATVRIEIPVTDAQIELLSSVVAGTIRKKQAQAKRRAALTAAESPGHDRFGRTLRKRRQCQA